MKEGYVVLKAKQGPLCLLWIGVIYMFFYMPISTLSSHLYVILQRNTGPCLCRWNCFCGWYAWQVILSIWGGLRNSGTSSFHVLLMGVNILSGLLPPTHFLSLLCAVLLWISAPFYGVQMRFFRNGQTRISGESFSLLIAPLPSPCRWLSFPGLWQAAGSWEMVCHCGIGIIIVRLPYFTTRFERLTIRNNQLPFYLTKQNADGGSENQNRRSTFSPLCGLDSSASQFSAIFIRSSTDSFLNSAWAVCR